MNRTQFVATLSHTPTAFLHFWTSAVSPRRLARAAPFRCKTRPIVASG